MTAGNGSGVPCRSRDSALNREGRKVAGRPRFNISLVFCIVAWLTIVYPLGWLSGSVWGAPPSSSATGETQEPVRLEPVVVSASRIEQKLRDVPTHVTIITREDIEQSTARTLDDLLRQIPRSEEH